MKTINTINLKDEIKKLIQETQDLNDNLSEKKIKNLITDWMIAVFYCSISINEEHFSLPKNINGLILLNSILYDEQDKYFLNDEYKDLQTCLVYQVGILRSLNNLPINTDRDRLVNDATKEALDEIKQSAVDLDVELEMITKNNFLQFQIKKP